ncbi:hypothetical protein MO867_14045 [Microbulbifer sp. OS29]|uniref:Uncharacterized protein n=1 Tax=Microbulbifer okhotskensis TaxID=2926617 RepID=A0A9X2EPJ0_9GAMM|nr:hypothetical protein [Microbulbifer okhotskensis]MCO1335456.1 hypothetical protein [Microbulbifer okhotskensis]
MNNSEVLLSELLSSLDIPHEKIEENEENKVPDFEVRWEGKSSYWEVKGLDSNKDEKKIIRNIQNDEVQPYQVNSKRVKDSIKDASYQFEEHGVTGHPCIVVIYDNRDFSVMDFMLPNYIKSAVAGKPEVIYKNGTYRECKRYYEMLSPVRKTYISAVALLSPNGKKITFYHNPYTNNPLIDSRLMKLFSSHYQAIPTEQGLTWTEVQPTED